MKPFFSSLALSLGLLMPVLAACSGADSEPAPSSSGTESVDSEILSGKKKSCASVGGTCVGLSPSSCTGGHFADANKVSCGPGIGAACCVTCPIIEAPPPGFCAGGHIVQRTNENGCTFPECVTCPIIEAPPPGFCAGGHIVQRTNEDGCTRPECVPDAPTACAAAGGTCVGLAPGSCAPGHWADATTHSCGGGIGVGCCLP
jgi:hypothetical protein